MDLNARSIVTGLVGAVAAFGVFGGFSALGRTGPTDPYEAIPKASFIAATVDFAEVRRWPLYDTVFGKGAAGADPMRRALGVDAVASACGFDPTTRIQKVAVAVPEEGERGEFGVVARVEVTREELETCTRSLADKRGGHAETRDVGSFVVLEDTSMGGAGAPRLAYGRGGLLVVGKGSWFDAMLAAANHAAPGLNAAAEHVALRTSLSSHEGFRTSTVLATAVLPRSLRERLKGEMGAEAEGDLSNAAMAGVLGVAAVGIAVAKGSGPNLDAAVELVCDSPDACAAVEKLVNKKRAEWSGELALRMIGLGPVLDAVEVKLEGSRLRVSTSAQADVLAGTVERILKLRARRGPEEPAPPSRRPPQDESIPARPRVPPIRQGP